MLKDFIKLYLKSIPISKIRRDSDINFRTFSLKTGRLQVTLVNTQLRLEEIYPRKELYPFTERHPEFLMIPIATCTQKIVGFILRGVSFKEYRIIFEPKKPSPLFGWEDFKDYQSEYPIVLCEGVKDAIYLKQHYKYVLSLNTSSISTANMEILKRMTNKVILSYDNDETGLRMSKLDSKSLDENGISCRIVKPNHKDCAEYLENSYGELDYLSILDSSLKLLGGDGCGIIKK